MSAPTQFQSWHFVFSSFENRTKRGSNRESLTILNIQKAREISGGHFRVSVRSSKSLLSFENDRVVKLRRFDPTELAVWVLAAFYEPAISLASPGAVSTHMATGQFVIS